jgi:hypothetical protein
MIWGGVSTWPLVVTSLGVTYVHANWHEKTGIESHKRGIFSQAVVLNESLFDALDEEDIQSGIDEKNNDFGGWIPAGIDLGESAQR